MPRTISNRSLQGQDDNNDETQSSLKDPLEDLLSPSPDEHEAEAQERSLPDYVVWERPGAEKSLKPTAEWMMSSQRAADLCASDDVKFWTKNDLADIEAQLEKLYSLDSFTVRRIDGSELKLKNHMCGVKNPIWEPEIQFRNYWVLTTLKPEQPPEMYLCSYLVAWQNRLDKPLWPRIANFEVVFETRRQLWEASESCRTFRSQIRGISQRQEITKIVCFGLGDMAFESPDYEEEHKKIKSPEYRKGSDIYKPMLQHAAVLTMEDEIRHCYGKTRSPPKMIVQDPCYSDETRALLTEKGMQVSGGHGAMAFLDVGDNTIVFTAWVSAPVKQIVADIARPAAFITWDNAWDFNSKGGTYVDAHSPRTRKMWQEYESWEFPVSDEDAEMMHGLKYLSILAKRV